MKIAIAAVTSAGANTRQFPAAIDPVETGMLAPECRAKRNIDRGPGETANRRFLRMEETPPESIPGSACARGQGPE
jgi:hypothetical protein